MTRSTDTSLRTLFSHHAATDRVAFIDLSRPSGPRRITYAALDRACDAVARGLVRHGAGVRDRVGILAANRAEYVEVLFGALRAGCVPVPVNIKLPRATIEFIVRESGMVLAFVEVAQRALLPDGIDVVDFDAGYAEFQDFGEFPAISLTADQVSMQLYTSGTTGRPKGVLLGHHAQAWAARAIAEGRRLSGDDRILTSAPFFHKNAVVALKSALHRGACSIILPRFEARQSIDAIERYECTMISGVPTMMHLILAERERLARTRTASLQSISMGSAPSSPALLEGLREAFPDVQIFNNYGTTEGGPINHGWFHPLGLPRPPNSVGYPLPDCHLRLVGGATEDEGELHVRNPGLALGYHNLPEETAAKFQDGWYRTGDILRRDKDGWYYVVGRIDDMFVCGGENIYPSEVEALLEAHQDILHAVVLPFKHPSKGDVPYAFVVKCAGANLDEAAVKAYALRNGPTYAYPRKVTFVPNIPLSGSNKVDRAALRRLME